MARAMKGRNEVKTLASITGQPEEDVVAMLKQHGGDVNAATNALMDSACPVPRAPSTLRFPVLSQRFFGEAVGGREKKNAIAPRPPPRRSTPPDPRAATPRSPRFRSGEVRGRRQGWKKEKGGARIARRAPTAASRHHGCPSWTLARERSILPAVPSRTADPTSPAPPIAGGPQASGARGQIERTREARWG